MKIEVKHFFYDLFHCKDKILDAFDKWDEKYDKDERGPLVAGIQDSSPQELVTLLITIQKMASGYQDIQDMITAAEEEELKSYMGDDEEDEEDDDF
jgi:hypothetical protein|tara:strand:+ start:88 stop:375 length:288 start_codon:yes stop_codon:yes gene_type:complete